MIKVSNIIFIHGLESSGHGFKGNLFRKIIPQILTPDFYAFSNKISLKDILQTRMSELETIIANKMNWIIIGSSFGGLMGTLFVLQNPDKVKLLILLAPFLNSNLLQVEAYQSVNIPVIVYHGTKDNIVLASKSRECAERLFSNLTYNLVEDDHQLHKTVSNIDWNNLLALYK
jgi:pimeloyl-ACP methyl ester carboxylesterase